MHLIKPFYFIMLGLVLLLNFEFGMGQLFGGYEIPFKIVLGPAYDRTAASLTALVTNLLMGVRLVPDYRPAPTVDPWKKTTVKSHQESYTTRSKATTPFTRKLTTKPSSTTITKEASNARLKRELTTEESTALEPFDVVEVEKFIVSEFGARSCIFERVCAHYAARAQSYPKPQMDWAQVFSNYKRSPDQTKEFYLLSVFLGDIVKSRQLCHQLGKRRSCDEAMLSQEPPAQFTGNQNN